MGGAESQLRAVGHGGAVTARVPAGSEFAVIDRLRHRLPSPPPGEVWIGDDAAVVGVGGATVLLATDLAVAGVHADLAVVSVADLGWRAVVAAVSDIAAVGGRPRHLLVAVAAPAETDLDELHEGVAAAAAACGCHVVGGDLSNGPGPVVAVSVVGVVEDGPGPVLRGGAEAGDHLFVTGPLGAAAAGLRTLRAAAGGAVGGAAASPVVEAHRRPVARLAEGEAARRAGARAMIDVSDGFGADLGHLADASGIGFHLDRVPVAPGATVDEALGGGDDYELVFAAPDPDRVLAAFAAAGLRAPVAVGTCLADTSKRDWGGRRLEATGYEHAWE